MSKIINISKDRLCLLQKALSLTSIIASVGIVALILLGFIPFGGYNTSPLGIFSLFLNVIDFGRRAFIHVICNVGFSVFYAFVCIKSILKIVKMLKNRKTWLLSKMDSNPVRAAVNFRVEGFNEIAWHFLLLTMVSVLVNGCQFTTVFTVILVTVFVVAAIINVARFICVKRNLEESILVPVSKVLVLVGAFAFAIFVCRTTVPSFWIGIGRFGALFSIKNISDTFTLEAFFKTVAVPTVQLIILFLLIRYAYDAFVSYVEITSVTKKLAIFATICVGVILLFNGYISEYRDPAQYLQMLLVEGMMALIPWFVFFVSKCTTITVPDCLLYDPAPGEKGLGDTNEPAKEEPATPTVAETVTEEPAIPNAEEPITEEPCDNSTANPTESALEDATAEPTASEPASNAEEQESCDEIPER